MEISLSFVPVPQWVHREFDGLDPWDGGKRTRWQVVVYQMLSKTFAANAKAGERTTPADSNAVPNHLAVGIAAPGGRYRVLPVVLQRLWREGQVRDEQLPELLHEIEAPLPIADYPPAAGPLLSIVVGTFSLLVAAVALTCFFAFAPPERLYTREVSAEKWLAQPMRGERSVWIEGDSAIDALTKLPAPVPAPAGVLKIMDASLLTRLGTVPAAGEHRLVLTTDADGSLGAGVVVSTSALHLPDAELAALRAKYPDLRTDYVFANGWKFEGSGSPADYAGVGFARTAGEVFAVIALLCLLPVTLTSLRRGAQKRRCLSVIMGMRPQRSAA
jgi:hypothetical protein